MHGRAPLTRHLRGSGIELGPGHQPFDLPPDVSVRYADRWRPEQNRVLYPELGEDVAFPDVDVVIDFDVDRLSAFPDASEDFVICSHVLEHLAEPLGFIGEMHRVLRPGAIAVVLLPDRTRTFDRHRAPTSVEHLAAEHDAGVTVVDDEHMVDFLTQSGPEAAFIQMPEGGDRAEFFDWHRRRSIHVHCWADGEFDAVLDYCRTLGQRWDIVDRLPLADDGIEFGYVLRKATPRRRRWRDRRTTRRSGQDILR